MWRADLRALQEPFWQFWTSALKQIGRVDLAVFNGDLIDGPGRKDSTKHVTTDLGEQVSMAVEIVQAVKADRKKIVRGTGFHVESGTNFEDIIARELRLKACDEYRAEVYGRRLHWRHVVGRSDIPYGQYTQAGKELTNEQLQAEMEDYPAADILLRAHAHYCVGISQLHGATGMLRQVWVLPGLQLRRPVSAYVRGLRTWMYHVGVTLIEVEPSGEVFVRPICFPIREYAAIKYDALMGARGARGRKR